MGFSSALQGKTAHDALLVRQDAELRLLEVMKRCLLQKVKCDKEYAIALTAAAQHGLKIDRADDLQGKKKLKKKNKKLNNMQNNAHDDQWINCLYMILWMFRFFFLFECTPNGHRKKPQIPILNVDRNSFHTYENYGTQEAKWWKHGEL